MEKDFLRFKNMMLQWQWNANYDALKAFVETYRHLPNKKKVENRGLLNWWKYNQRLIKQGKLAVERVQLLSELSKMRILK